MIDAVMPAGLFCQMYIGFPASAGEPPLQLKGFTKVTLAPKQVQSNAASDFSPLLPIIFVYRLFFFPFFVVLKGDNRVLHAGRLAAVHLERGDP